MKIYYYKQPENTFAFFGRRNVPIRLRYIALGLVGFIIIAHCFWKLRQPHTLTPIAPPIINRVVPTQTTGFDEETRATSLRIQNNIEASSNNSDDVVNHKADSHSVNTKMTPNCQTVMIKPKDTLAKIFVRMAVNKQELPGIMHSGESAEALKKLKPGQKLQITVNNHRLQQLTYVIDPLSTLIITRTSANTFNSLIKTANLQPKQTFAKFTVYGSVNASAKKAGLDSKRTAALANIFKTSVDFTKGNHTGDKINVLFQDYFLNGKKVKEGEIVAAEYKTATNTYQAVRFTDPKGNSGYYAPDGTSMQKRFLPAPVKFTRISSLFNPKRWHPLLHRFRHHQGVDYAAPYGTPIKSVANGTIAMLGQKGGYGNTIVIKHDSSYSTLYGHLSKYASGLKVGSNVQQGQLIGYVGSSGLATGPHLHFEFRINGVHRNPLTVALPNGKSITHAYRNKFHNEVKKLLAKLDAHKNCNSG